MTNEILKNVCGLVASGMAIPLVRYASLSIGVYVYKGIKDKVSYCKEKRKESKKAKLITQDNKKIAVLEIKVKEIDEQLSSMTCHSPLVSLFAKKETKVLLKNLKGQKQEKIEEIRTLENHIRVIRGI